MSRVRECEGTGANAQKEAGLESNVAERASKDHAGVALVLQSKKEMEGEGDVTLSQRVSVLYERCGTW